MVLYQDSIFAKIVPVIEPLVEEHLLCAMKIKQLESTKRPDKAELITILENLQKQDEKRMIEAIRSIETEGI